MLPLLPVVRVQVLPFLQVVLHEPAQLPTQVLPCSHLNEQLPPWALQPVPIHVQLLLAVQAQVLPVQAQPGPGQPPETDSAPQPTSEPRPASDRQAASSVERREENSIGAS